MSKQALTAFVPRTSGQDVIVVRVPDHPIRGRWDAQRVINAMRVKLPLELITQDVVVVSSDLEGKVLVLGSSPEAEAFVKAVASELPDYKWQPKELDF